MAPPPGWPRPGWPLLARPDHLRHPVRLHERRRAADQSEYRRQLKPTSWAKFSRRYFNKNARMHGLTCILWADLTPFLPKAGYEAQFVGKWDCGMATARHTPVRTVTTF